MKPVILLRSGIDFDLSRPNPDHIDIADIAHALAHICRYTGHSRWFYSVAQHSVLTSYLVRPSLAMQALLHDATEAYIGDVSAPLKAMLPDYRAIEARVAAAVAERFGLPMELHAEVKWADLTMLATEKRDMMPATAEPWPVELTHPPVVASRLQPLGPEDALALFMDRFNDLAAKAAA